MHDVYNDNGVPETSMSDSQISMLSKTFSFWIYTEDFCLARRFLVGFMLLILKLIGEVRVVSYMLYKMM